MAFGNPYSPGYMPGYYQMGQQMPPPMPDQLAQLRQGYQQPAQQQPTPIIWVQGEEGAKAYMVAAGNSVLLMDSENSVFYIKSTDASGMPQPLRIFDYTERGKMAPQKAETADGRFVTREEFDALRARFDALTAEKPGKGGDDGKPSV
nr:MAG TPA: hypothetical protein [Caudoviricetes sp.]